MTYQTYTPEQVAAVFGTPAPAPTPQEIIDCAIELHKFYRAAIKALHRPADEQCHFACGLHDHGFAHCSKKAYFLKRAAMLLAAPGRKAELAKVPF
jgi:hypothetical protein